MLMIPVLKKKPLFSANVRHEFSANVIYIFTACGNAALIFKGENPAHILTTDLVDLDPDSDLDSKK